MCIYDSRFIFLLLATTVATFVLPARPASAAIVYDLTATPASGVDLPAFTVEFTDQNSDGLLGDADIINGFSGLNQYDVLVRIPTIAGFANGSAADGQWGFAESGNPALGAGISPAGWTYSISQQVAAVPEASTWAMLLLGFAGLWHLSRRSKQLRTRPLSLSDPQVHNPS